MSQRYSTAKSVTLESEHYRGALVSSSPCHPEKEGSSITQELLGAGVSCVTSADEHAHLGKVYKSLGDFQAQRTTTRLITGTTELSFVPILVILPRGQCGATTQDIRSYSSSGVGSGKEIFSIQRVKGQENKTQAMR